MLANGMAVASLVICAVAFALPSCGEPPEPSQVEPAPRESTKDQAFAARITPSSAAESSVSRPPLPKPSAEPVELAEATPEFAIARLATEVVGTTETFHEVQFTAWIDKLVETDRQLPTDVEASLDGEAPQILTAIDSDSASESLTFAATRRLGPGEHIFEVSVGGSRKSIAVSIAAADLEVEILPYRIRREGWITLPVEISNRGKIASEGVRVRGMWSPPPDDYLWRNNMYASVGRLGAGDSELVEFPVDILAGGFQFEVSVTGDTIESAIHNNVARTKMRIRYARLDLVVPAPPKISYEDRQPIAEFEFEINNVGHDGSGPIWAGFVHRA